MSRFFVWLVQESAIETLGPNGGVSPCYALPDNSQDYAHILPNAYVYVIVRSNKGDYVFARLVVDMVEQLQDESGNPLGHLLSVNTEKSLRFIKSVDEIHADEYKAMDVFAQFNHYGLFPANDFEIDALDGLLCKNMPWSWSNFTNRELSRIDPPVSGCSGRVASRILIREIASKFSVSELWGSTKERNPLANLAAEYLRAHPEFITEGNSEAVIDELSRMPLLPINDFKDAAGVEEHSASLPGEILSHVDVAFTPIIPGDVRSRIFVAGKTSPSPEEAARKTEAAEKRHQEMLKDIASHYLECGYRPYQTTSIDMAIRMAAGIDIFELKSISINNAISQIAKGCFQLLYYSDSLAQVDIAVAGRGLIAEAHMPKEAIIALSRILGKVGITLHLYDANEPWPRRLMPGLIPEQEGAS